MNRQMEGKTLSEHIKSEARRLGFFSSGIAEAKAVDANEARRLLAWLADGGNADMQYMGNHTDMRLDPRLLMPGVKSIVSVALAYAPSHRIPEDEYQIAAYAYGADYHDVVKQKLHSLAASIAAIRPIAYRAFCDSAPVLERYWAVQAGLGWVGRNRQLIIPQAGSMFFLGELFLDIELDYDSPVTPRCGNCRACVDACPTHALQNAASPCPDGCPHSTTTFSAARCLSYLTIENRGPIPSSVAPAMRGTIYGCDRCLQACPWNRFAPTATEPLLQPSAELLQMTKERWHDLTPETYRRLFKGSAVKRAKYEGLMRNIRANIGATRDSDAVTDAD